MSPLEKMDDFFAVRVDGYDEHMMSNVERASDFYAYTASLLPKAAGSKVLDYTASLLPKTAGSNVLDLGCGTGLELEEYFGFNPQAKVTGIDLSEAMLNALKAKFPEKDLTLVQASYFDVPLGENVYDAAVSVESLHHFKDEMKESLYRKLRTALKAGGTFVLTDCFAESFYHFDTPLTVEHEMDVLRRAGFRDVRIDKRWSEKTCTVLATV